MSAEGYRVGAVLLAAGASKRFGDRNKLLTEFDGQPMVRHVARILLQSRADPIVAVTGHDRAGVVGALAGLAVEVVHNVDYALGMSGSLRVGVAALASRHAPPVDGAMICLADMPWVRPEHLDALMRVFDPADGRSICAPVYGRRRGNPVVWAASYFGQIDEITGDVGARDLLARHVACVHEIVFEDSGVARDIDLPDGLPEGPGEPRMLRAEDPDEEGAPWRR